MDEIKQLIEGFARFKYRFFEKEPGLFKQLIQQGQSPKIMVVACCDARVDPAIITDCSPGDLFVVRNVANLVPPYEIGGRYHGTSAALEFAIRTLHVGHIIVLGHSQCGGIQTLLDDASESQSGEFIAPWMAIAKDACEHILSASAGISRPEKIRACEQVAIRTSLQNLLTFPWVSEAVEQRRLELHGWYFDIERGQLLTYNPASACFSIAES